MLLNKIISIIILCFCANFIVAQKPIFYEGDWDIQYGNNNTPLSHYKYQFVFADSTIKAILIYRNLKNNVIDTTYLCNAKVWAQKGNLYGVILGGDRDSCNSVYGKMAGTVFEVKSGKLIEYSRIPYTITSDIEQKLQTDPIFRLKMYKGKVSGIYKRCKTCSFTPCIINCDK